MLSFAACGQCSFLGQAWKLDLRVDHISHDQLTGSPDVPQEKLKFSRSFVAAAQSLLNDLSELGIRVAEWTNYRWSTEYYKNTSIHRVFISSANTGPFGMGLPKTTWIKLNCPCIGFRCFIRSCAMVLALSSNYKSGAAEQTADCLISQLVSLMRNLRGVIGLTVLDNDIRCNLDAIIASI